MDREIETDDRIELVARRADFIRALVAQALRKRDLVEELDTSRATVNRAVCELEEAGLVTRCPAGHTATLAGRLALERYRAYVRESNDVLGASDVLAPLGPDCALDGAAVAGGDVHLAAEPAPYRPLEVVHDAIARSDAYRAVLPALADPRHVRLCYEHVVIEGQEAVLTVSPELFETIREEFPRQLPAMADADEFEIYVGEVPKFGVVLTRQDVTRRDGRATVSVLVFDEGGTLHGVVRNHAEDAVRWAEELFDRVAEDSRRRTDRIGDDDSTATRPDGAVPATLRAGLEAPATLSPVLEAEGFVRLGTDYFASRRVSDPTTAWRRGLDLVEVQAGYAVDRTVPGSDGAESLADDLIDRLRAGTDGLLVGPPGSGKSTVCKQVALDWHRTGDPVVYRESGRGRAFGSVDELLATVRDADGVPLVVVEDAVRPETVAVFAAMAEIGDGHEVAFLLDSRESEWSDPPVECDVEVPRDAVDVTAMPPLHERDWERLVAHFQETVGKSVDAPLDRLRAGVRGSTHDEDAPAPAEVLLVLHRLALYADPLAEDETTLHEDVATVYRELRTAGDLELDVGVLVNLGNAAGFDAAPEVAVTLADGDDHERVRDALATLEGRVLFPHGDEVRTVHEVWSVEFLARLLEDQGTDAAASRFGRCVTAKLSLAEDPDRLDRVRQAVDGASPTADRVADDPGGWATEVTERIFTLGREWPKLAPLFGTSEDSEIRLPEPCRGRLAARLTEWRARMYLNGGHYDRAEREFEHLGSIAAARSDGPAADLSGVGAADRSDGVASDRSNEHAATLGIRRLLGLCDIAREQSDFETAVEYGEECLARIDEAGTVHDEARCRYALGDIDVQRDSFERAERHLTEALECAERAGDRRIECNTLRLLGNLCFRRENLAEAEAYYERTGELARELGYREMEGAAVTNLGNIAYMRGDLATARDYYHQGLDVARRIGDRRREAVSLRNLGLIARKRGNLDAAERYGSESLELARERDIQRLVIENRCDLGVVRRRRGNLDASEADFSRTLELAADIDMPHRRVDALTGLGMLEWRRGNFAAAENYLDEALDRLGDGVDRSYEAVCRRRLGVIARDRGDLERAVEHATAALAIVRDLGDRRREADCLLLLGSIRRRQGGDDAEGYLREALSLARDVDHPGIEIRCLRELGDSARERGDVDEAESYLTASLDLAAERGDPWTEADAVGALGRLERARGNPVPAREHLEDAVTAYRELGAPHRALGVARVLVDSWADCGDFETAVEWCETAIDLAADANRDEMRADLRDRCEQLSENVTTA